MVDRTQAFYLNLKARIGENASQKGEIMMENVEIKLIGGMSVPGIGMCRFHAGCDYKGKQYIGRGKTFAEAAYRVKEQISKL